MGFNSAFKGLILWPVCLLGVGPGQLTSYRYSIVE